MQIELKLSIKIWLGIKTLWAEKKGFMILCFSESVKTGIYFDKKKKNKTPKSSSQKTNQKIPPKTANPNPENFLFLVLAWHFLSKPKLIIIKQIWVLYHNEIRCKAWKWDLRFLWFLLTLSYKLVRPVCFHLEPFSFSSFFLSCVIFMHILKTLTKESQLIFYHQMAALWI